MRRSDERKRGSRKWDNEKRRRRRTTTNKQANKKGEEQSAANFPSSDTFPVLFTCSMAEGDGKGEGESGRRARVELESAREIEDDARVDIRQAL